MMHFKGLLSETMRAVFTLVCLPLMLSGCGGAPTPQETPSPDGQTPATSTITTGDAVSSGGGALDAGHGVITVDTADSPLKGLTVEVPEGAYSQPTAFNVSYRPILADNLPEGAEPISPLIMIDNGGRAADDLMVITVPISISESEFATAFRYNAAEDRLDALPLVDSSATAVSVAVRRFGSSAGSASAKLVRNLAASDAAQGPDLRASLLLIMIQFVTFNNNIN